MERKLTAAIVCLLFAACPVFAADVQVDGFGPAEIAAADRISLIGPTEATSGDEVTLRMTGAPPLDLTLPLIDQLGWLMGDDRMYCYLAAPGADLVSLDVRGELVFSVNGATMQPLLRVMCGQPGEYRVLVDWNHGQNQLVDHRLTVWGRDGPDPPDPPPPPPPDKIAGMWIVVVEDVAKRTPEQFHAMNDPVVLKWIETNGHHLYPVPISVKDESAEPPSDKSPWMDEAEGKILPHVFLVPPDDGTARFSGPFPESGNEVLKLLKQYGAEK